MSNSRTGIWLIGARGGVATTAILGLSAVTKRLIGSVGLTSSMPMFQNIGLPDWDDFVVGGHEIRRGSIFQEAARMAADDRIVRPELVERCREDLDQIDGRIRPGTILNVGQTISGLADDFVPTNETPRQALQRIGRDMAQFAETEKLDHVVVVNVASTEPMIDVSSFPKTWSELDRAIDRQGEMCLLPASSLYAIAAFEAGWSYINFTPSLGPNLPAIDELCRDRGARYYGCDGKTGETLMKSVLAPMFERRNMEVLSWVGHNIFGNMDGRVLDDPENKRSKAVSKDHLVREILGYPPKTLVSIEYVPDLGDWKTAWDHIHFSGFLGLPMTLQFIWQGCDSVLAAPLVLDLARFTELARRRGHVGQMPFLASFFKSPYGATEHRFDRQFQTLEQWAANA